MKLIIKICFLFISFQCYSQTPEKENLSKLDSINHIYIPKNLEECFTQMDSFWNDSVKLSLKNLSESEFTGCLHFGTGLWMRNNWGLWAGSRLAKFFNEKGIYHPDDMSGIILDSYHRKLNNKPINMEKQIKFYQEYWAKAKAKALNEKQNTNELSNKNLKWLSDNKIPINKLFKVDSNLIRLTCDSNLIIKQVKEDSIFLWTTESETYLDAKETK